MIRVIPMIHLYCTKVEISDPEEWHMDSFWRQLLIVCGKALGGCRMDINLLTFSLLVEFILLQLFVYALI